ncbi:helix-turn-helix domain-containing protein [Paenibacillus sp. CAU 1782]
MNKVWLTADRMTLVRDIGWNRTDSAYMHPDRVLEYDVFLYVLKGCMRVMEDGTEFSVHQGEHLFLKKGLHHWGSQPSDAGTSWYWIHFNTPDDGQPGSSGLSGYSERLPMLEAGFYTTSCYHYRMELPKHGRIALHPSLDNRLIALLDDYQRLQLHGMSRTSLEVCKLFLDLHEASVSVGAAAEAYGKGASLVGKVMTYLADHADGEYQAAALARHLEMNYNYISTAFRRLTGGTIIEAHAKLRINKAIDLMRHTSLNVAEISERLGYKNPYYFSRVFKKIMGEPPSSYWRHLYK